MSWYPRHEGLVDGHTRMKVNVVSPEGFEEGSKEMRMKDFFFLPLLSKGIFHPQRRKGLLWFSCMNSQCVIVYWFGH